MTDPRPCTCPSELRGDRPVCKEQCGEDEYCKWERICERREASDAEARYQALMKTWAVGRLAPK